MALPPTKVVLPNISYWPGCNTIVRRDLKEMIMTSEDSSLQQFKYIKPRPCLKCGKLFPDSVDMLVHIQLNHIKMVNCPNCGKFMTSWKLKKWHRHVCRTVKEKFVCKQCGETVSSEKKLARHNLTIHTPSLQSRCVFCEQTFNSRSHLRTHLQCHKPTTHRPVLAEIQTNHLH